MIERWFEPFTLLERVSVRDEMGGEHVAFDPVLSFQGVMSLTAEAEVTIAEQAATAETLVLLHEFDVTLAPGDHVRRERDGARFRVTGRSDDRRAPAFSGLRFAQVHAERVVIPC